MARRAKRWAIALGTFVAVFFAAYTGVFLLWNDEAIAHTVNRWVSASLRGRGGPTQQAFVIGRARYPYWGGIRSLLLGGPCPIQAWNTTIYDPDGNEVMFVPYASGKMWIGELVRSQFRSIFGPYDLELHWAEGDVPTARCHVATDREGGVNLVDAFAGKRPAAPKPGGGMRIKLDSAVLHDVEFSMALPGWHAEVHHLGGRAALSYSNFADETAPGRPMLLYEVTPLHAQGGALTLGETLPPGVRARPDGAPLDPKAPKPWRFPLEEIDATRFGSFADKRDDMVFQATARSLGAPVTVEGRLQAVYGHSPGAELALRFSHGHGLLGLLPTGDLLGGDPSGSLHIHGPFAHIAIDGHAEGAEVHLAGVTGRDARADFAVKGSSLLLTNAGTTVGGGAIAADLAIDFQRMAWRGDFTSSRVDPAGLAPLVPPQARPWVGGRLGGRVRLEASLIDHPERVRARDLDMRLVRRRVRGDALPSEIAFRGGLRLSPDRIHLDGLSLSGDGVAATASGDLNPVAATAAATVTIDARHPMPLLRRLGLTDVELGGLHAALKVGGKLVEPTVEGRVSASTVGWLGREIPSAEAHVRFAHGTLVADGLSGLGPLGGQITGGVTLSLFDGPFSRPRHDPPLKLDLSTSGVSLQALAGTPSLAGRLIGNLRLDGTLAHPRGDATVELPALTFYGDSYRRGVLAVDLGERGVGVKKLYIEREDGGYVDLAPKREGTIHRDGALDLDVVLRDFPLAAIPQLRDMPIFAGLLSGALHVGGDVHRWIPSGLIEAVAIRVRELKLGNGRLALAPEGDAIRLAGDFFDRFKVDGRLRLYPAPALDVSVTFTDFPLDELIPELRRMTGSNEVHGVVSGRADITFDVLRGIRAQLTLSKVLLSLEGEDEGDETGTVHRADQFRNEEPVVITTDGKALHFEQARLRSRLGTFEVHGDLSGTRSDLVVRGQLDLALLEYFFSKVFAHTHGEARADLHLRGAAVKPEVTGTLDLEGAELQPRDVEKPFTVPSGSVRFEPGRITLTQLRAQLDGAEAEANGSLSFVEDTDPKRTFPWVARDVALEVKGAISPTLLAWLFPENIAEAKGRLEVAARLSGRWPKPRWSGRIDIAGLDFRAKRLGRDVHVASGAVTLDDDDLTLRQIVTRIDDGKLTIDGRVGLPGFQLGDVDVRFEAENLDWATPSYSVTLSSPGLVLKGDGRHLALSGPLILVDGQYRQDFDTLGEIIKPHAVEREEPFYRGYPLLERLALDVTATASGTLLVKSNIAELYLSIDKLTIGGTLDEPSFDGSILVEEGGRFVIPFLRTDTGFITDRNSTITFRRDKRFPSDTPTLAIAAWADWEDRNQQLHHIDLKIRGTFLEPDIDLSSQDGWDRSKVLEALFIGSTSEDLHGQLQTQPGARNSTGAADALAKQATGQALGFVENPLKHVLRLDTLRIELGTDSVLIRACPVSTRQLKVCGLGDVGFATTARYSASSEMKLTDEFSLVGVLEHIEHGVDTPEDILNRFKLQLQLKWPIH